MNEEAQGSGGQGFQNWLLIFYAEVSDFGFGYLEASTDVSWSCRFLKLVKK